ncbi:MAG: hypothetical protein ACREUX_22050, partial [Burkholderiales bacterium]
MAMATELVRDGYYWYVPEHEKYSRTTFFSEPSFQSGLIRITRTERFQFVAARRGWALLQFDSGTRAYIHLRLLNILLWNPAASDPWHEFKRASVFAEEPEKIEARLKSGRTEPGTAESKVPIWKRYKDSWGIHKGRSQSSASDSDADGVSTPTPEKKKRNKYPLLPPIGSQPQPGNGEQPAQDAE